jgi:hypothetical protein
MMRILICIFILISSLPLVADNSSDKRVSELHRKYAKASTPEERRAICIEAIDLGIIDQDVHVSVLDQIFGSELSKRIPHKAQDLKWGAIHFSPQEEQRGRPIQIPYVGWYLAVQFDSRGQIDDYYLSNLHK